MFHSQSFSTTGLLPKGQLRNVITGLLFCTIVDATAQEVRFTVLKGGDPVGSIRAARSISGEHTSYLITSSSVLWMIWKQEVETSMTANFADGYLASCNYKLLLNGKMRDSSRLSGSSSEKWAYVHPDPPVPYRSITQWTTSRLYFEEPIGKASIMVESVLRDCPLRHLGPGIYELTLPNKDRNRYIYKGGRLMEVQAERLLISLVFRRA